MLIPNTITTIGKYAFAGCKELQSACIPKNITSIMEHTFSGCDKLTFIDIPCGITHILSGAFSGCSNLTSITIPNSVKLIDKDVFKGCTTLKNATIENGEKDSLICFFDETPFMDCPLESLYLGRHIIPSSQKIIQWNIPTLNYLTIGSGITTLGGQSNENFTQCGLKVVTIENGEKPFHIGWLSNYPTDTLIINRNLDTFCFICDTTLKSVIFGDNVTTHEWSFRGCSNLNSIKLGNSISSIFSNAFYGCSNLTSIKIPNSVKTIGWHAFYDCI